VPAAVALRLFGEAGAFLFAIQVCRRAPARTHV